MPYTNSVNNEFLNNVTVSTSTAGITSTLTISNLDNSNTASHAKASATTGGASAGDAYIHFTNNVVDWSIGIDNSDSDAFLISKSSTLGSTNVARCSSAGEWNYPLQCGFNAYRENTVSNVTGAGATYDPVEDVETFDQNGDYSTANGQFTAPVTGKYLLTSCSWLTGGTTYYSSESRIYTSNRLYKIMVQKSAGDNQPIGSGGAVIADMDASDIAYVIVKSDGQATNVVDYEGAALRNHFSGALLQ